MKTLANIDRRSSEFVDLIQDLKQADEFLRQGTVLRAADVTARRAYSEMQRRDNAITAARESFAEFALMVDQPILAEGELLEVAFQRVDTAFAKEETRLKQRLNSRLEGNKILSTLRSLLSRRDEIEHSIKIYTSRLLHINKALIRGKTLRENGQEIRTAVDEVRSEIIRREFNDRLNRVWRDLFVRLAPEEPFVPAFRIPPPGTRRLQPKLITMHREGGGAGGAPGAMLSAGNLNTAALTLFMALHLSVPATLPWLILDDPVQSMDDIHIAHFAALLRTISKEHGRQIIIAVHDRQLFEYLKLELSPAYPEDSLLAIELSRGVGRDTLCLSERLSFREETAVLSVA
jgi:exonuclease SbcC